MEIMTRNILFVNYIHIDGAWYYKLSITEPERKCWLRQNDAKENLTCICNGCTEKEARKLLLEKFSGYNIILNKIFFYHESPGPYGSRLKKIRKTEERRKLRKTKRLLRKS